MRALLSLPATPPDYTERRPWSPVAQSNPARPLAASNLLSSDMKQSALPWLILAAVAVSAVLAWWTLTRGVSGAGRPTIRSEHRVLAPFHAVEIGGSAHVTLVQGDDESIDVEAARGVRIDAEVSSGRLAISAYGGRRSWSGLLGRREGDAANVTVHFRTLDAIGLGGNVKLAIPKLQAAALIIRASGGAALTIDDLQASRLRVEGSGALDAQVAGRVDEERVSISGAGSYRAERLHATDATVSVSGVGNVVLHAERTLRATISGAGNIEYLGDPQVTEHVSGIGRVKRIESTAVPGMRIAQAPLNATAAAPLRLP